MPASPRTARQRQTGVVFVTHRTKKILGVRCRVVRDTGLHRGQAGGAHLRLVRAGPRRQRLVLRRGLPRLPQRALGPQRRLVEGRRPRREAGHPDARGPAAGPDLPPGVLPRACAGRGHRARPRRHGAAAVQDRSATRSRPARRRSSSPTSVEHKYYAPGLGEIKSVEVKGGKEATRLVSVSRSR